MKNFTQNNKSTIFSLLLFLALLTPLNAAFPFAFLFSGETNGVDIVAHPIGYSGAGGTITVSVGIDPTSVNASDMAISTQNVVAVINEALSTTGNLTFGPLPSGNVDFESVLLHEMGHSLGLRHCNLASESGLSGTDREYTQSTDGVDNVFGLNPGFDGIIGTEDDIRGDDVNLNYFKISDNNPFTIASTVDQTTYSRDLADLPSGNFSVNGDRTVANSLGYVNTEAVMQQGTFTDEHQRTLGADDLAGLLYAMAGIDEISGTADDYTLILTYAGLTNNADIVIDFDNAETGFAVSQSGGAFIASDHIAIGNNNIYFNSGYSWYFNTVALPVPPAVVCTPHVTTLGVDGTVTISASDVDGGTTDANGDSFTLSVSPSTFTCADVGENTVTLTATDTNGMSSSCNTTVTISEGGSTLAAICQNPTFALDTAGSVTITTADIDGGSTVGNCGFDSMYMTVGFEEVTKNVSTTSNFNGGANKGLMFDIIATNTIEINSFDIRPFNTVGATASYEVYFKTGSLSGSETTEDDWTLVASPIITSVTDSAVTPLNLTLGINVAPGERVAFYIAPTDGSALLIATATGAGNLWTSDSNLEFYEGGLHDYPFSGSVGDFVFNGNVVYTIPALFDGIFDCTDVGANTVTLNVKDQAGSIASCDATVTIEDDENPTMTCPGDEVVNPMTGETTYVVPDYFALGSVTGTDNCASALVNTSQSPVAGTILGYGEYTVTCNAEDATGNVGTCTFQLTVEDNSLGIDENNLDLSKIGLYPNPAKNSISITNSQSLNLQKINIYDLSGRLVISERLDSMESEKTINVSKLQCALYICVIISDNGQLVRRIVKE